MRHAKAWALAIGFTGVFAGYPWVLSWAFIRDPSPDEVRRLAEPLMSQPARPIYAVNARGAAVVLAPADIAALTPGPCLRDHETEAFGRRAFEVRVTHWCRIDLSLQDASQATAGIVQTQWVGDPPDGLHEDSLLAEPHELLVLMQRLGR